MDHISKQNPDLEQIREQGYAWVIRGKMTGNLGAPFADEEYAENSPGLVDGSSELIIVSFE